ncbi:MAG TPA: STAS domain-containing protein [Acidimicrobiales bacterium]|nr:STAS domain-containing protein [Acidimicrobiales bacterium]
MAHPPTLVGKNDAVLTVEFTSTASLCVLTLAGELNGTSIAALEVQIDQIGCSHCSGVVLDVSALRKLDSVGTRVLVGLDHYVQALGARLAVTGATGQVAEALATTRVLCP